METAPRSITRRELSSADRLICVAPYVEELLGDSLSSKVEFMSETGVMHLPPLRIEAVKKAERLRLLFVGRVIRSKGVRDAIRAIAQVGDLRDIAFDVVGDGEDLPMCKEEAARLGILDKLNFHGRLPRKDVDAFYSRADVFLFPSFREPSGNAVIEAMSHGLALIVADRGGPGFVVDEKCGLRIPVNCPLQFASQIAVAIRKLAGNPALVAAMGVAAREKVKRQFLWDVKIGLLEQLYSKVLISRAGN